MTPRNLIETTVIETPTGTLACINESCKDFNEPMPDWTFPNGACGRCGVPVLKEERLTAEVDQLLQQNNITREEIAAVVDEDDPMAILQQANIKEPEPFIPTAAAYDTPAGDFKDEPSMYSTPTTDAEAAEIPIEQLKREVELEEERYLPLFGRAAVLEAELKRRKQDFDKNNAVLIADMRAAVAERDAQAAVLKALAKAYGKRTKEKQFDQYISFRENSIITWDEPEMIKWLKEHFEAALIRAGVSIDEGRLKTYIRDCLKKNQELPPTVKVDTEWETLLSSKIPVPELVGGAV